MKTLTLKPGTIIIWKEYGPWKRFWSKLTGKKLTNNRCTLISTEFDWIILSEIPGDAVVLEPKKEYNEQEKGMLSYLAAYNDIMLDEIEQLSAVNIIRPSTFDLSTLTLDNIIDNKYYRKIC